MFGLRRHDDSIHTELVPECSAPLLEDVVSGREDLASVLQPNDWVSRYHALMDMHRGRYVPVQWHGSQRPQGVHTLNGVESFWVYTRRRLKQFMGIPQHTFYLHLKETEYRFNRRREDLYTDMLALLRKHPL